MKRLLAFALLVFWTGCGIYTFSGSALPPHIKTVAIPLFANRTTEPGIAVELTRIITDAYITDNRLRVVENNASSTLLVTISGYTDEPFSYDEQGNVKEYRVTVRALAVFRDEKKSKDLWKEEAITCQGTYRYQQENEETGKQRAMKELANILLENTISGW
jgi:outer membrane lipopolysaccharide assembly protein LptE/RlpB